MLSDRITRILEPLLRLLWPPEGRRRATPRGRSAAPPVGVVSSAPGPAPRGPMPHNEHGPLVRPYFVDHERTRTRRRRVLRVAGHGIDVGPRVIQRVEVGP